MFFSAGAEVTGCRHQPRTMADATELSSACALAADAGKTAGEAFQATSGLPTVADYRTHQQLSNWHTAAVAEG